MPSRIPMPPDIAGVYLDFDWDKRRVWALDIEPEILSRKLLDWHLDLTFWSSRPSAPLFDLAPRQVVEDPSVHRVHAKRIEQADLSFPLDVMEHGGRLCVMDGLHRLAKIVRQGREQITVRRIPRAAIPGIRAEPG